MRFKVIFSRKLFSTNMALKLLGNATFVLYMGINRLFMLVQTTTLKAYVSTFVCPKLSAQWYTEIINEQRSWKIKIGNVRFVIFIITFKVVPQFSWTS